MVKQHVYLFGPGGGRVVAASPEIQYGYWSTLFRRHAEQYAAQGCTVAVYGQYQSERGVVLSRLAPDPDGGEGAAIAHHLLLDEPGDAEALAAARPVDAAAFVDRFAAPGIEPAALPRLDVKALSLEDTLTQAFEALDRFFGDSAELLAQFIAALAAAADDPAFRVVCYVDDAPRRVTASAHALMELVLRCLPDSIARRLGYRSFYLGAEPDGEFPVVFSTPGGMRLTGAALRTAVRFYFPERFCACHDGVPVEAGARDRELATAMLARDLNWVDRVARAEAHQSERPADVRLELPPFERGMSLRQYVCDWIDELSDRRSQIDDRALHIGVINWGQLESRIISAADRMESHMDYLRELSEVIELLERREPGDWLRVPPEVVLGLKAILVDSIAWLNVDIYDRADQELMLRIRGYAPALRREAESADFAQKLRALHCVGALLAGEIDAVPEGVRLLGSLADRSLLHGVQSCLTWYVDRRCRGRGGAPVDDLLAGAMALGYLRLGGDAPSLRLEALKRMVGKWMGEDARRQCETRVKRLIKDSGIRLERAERPPRRPVRARRPAALVWWLTGLAIALTVAAIAWLLFGAE
ncbi:MAG: hypothetical protein GX558_06725 [Clostridiales bacterium]|nr:hypothetical protein [Clostridiales bacterium]